MTEIEILTSHPPCDPLKVWKDVGALDSVKRIESQIDIDGFQQYLRDASYPQKYMDAFGELFTEKALEHYVSIELLGYEKDDISVDIAASSSPFADIVESLFGCVSYRQDLIYPPGIDGKKIGGCATDLPMDDESITRMTLHCSLEHFERNQDSLFIAQAIRKLKRGGKICVIQLYLREVFYNNTDPELGADDVRFDEGAKILHTRGWNNRFGRNYNVSEFHRRVLQNCSDAKVALYRFDDAKKAHPRCYLTFALVIEKK